MRIARVVSFQDLQNYYFRSIDSDVTTRRLSYRFPGLSFQLWSDATSPISLLDLSPSPLQITHIPLCILELGWPSRHSRCRPPWHSRRPHRSSSCPPQSPIQCRHQCQPRLGPQRIRRLPAQLENQEDETALTNLPFQVIVASNVVSCHTSNLS